MSAHTCEPVGTSDIAARLDLKPNTVAVYGTRGILPPPRWRVSGQPAWCYEHDIAPLVGTRLGAKRRQL